MICLCRSHGIDLYLWIGLKKPVTETEKCLAGPEGWLWLNKAQYEWQTWQDNKQKMDLCYGAMHAANGKWNNLRKMELLSYICEKQGTLISVISVLIFNDINNNS